MHSFVERDPYDLGQNDHFAQIKVEHISITDQELNRIIAEIVLNDDNLSFVFSQNINGNDFEKDLALRRFLPDSRPANLMDYIFDEIQKNRSFYSFLGEVILAICLRDVYKYSLLARVIWWDETIFQTHQGCDACLYDKARKLIVLGEAKFYAHVDQAIDSLRDSLVSNETSLLQKLRDLRMKVITNCDTRAAVFAELGKDQFDEFTVDELLRTDVVVAGFILHGDGQEQTGNDFARKCGFTSNDIGNSCSKCVGSEEPITIRFICLHLPINSKPGLIKAVMERAYDLRRTLKGGKAFI